MPKVGMQVIIKTGDELQVGDIVLSTFGDLLRPYTAEEIINRDRGLGFVCHNEMGHKVIYWVDNGQKVVCLR